MKPTQEKDGRGKLQKIEYLENKRAYHLMQRFKPALN